MNSRFYYPVNTGSLGEPRRARNFMLSIEHRPSAHFEVAHTKAPTSQVTKPTILVVEDDFGSLAALKSILTTKGYRVLEASDPKEHRKRGEL